MILRRYTVYRTIRRVQQHAKASYSNQLVFLMIVFLAQYYSRIAFLGYPSLCETIDGSLFGSRLEVVCRLDDRRAEGVTLRRLASHCCRYQAGESSLPEILQD